MDQPKAESVGWTILCTLCTLACHFVAIAVVTVVMIRVVPEFLNLFEDYEVELPNVTIWVLQLSFAFVSYWYLLVLALPIDGVVYFLLRRTPAKVNWLATIVLVLPLLLAIATLALTMPALFLPLVKLVSTGMPPGEV
jgi:type IV pilus assembly protein PilC